MRSSARCGEPDKRAFFGRRKGHRLKPQQAVLLDTLLPRLALDISTPAPALTSLFEGAVSEVRLEIGFGGGEHLIAEAERNAQTGFIGVEPFVNGMAKALSAIAAKSLRNIRLHWKRRFVQDATVAAIARVLKPGGTFRFATDWPDYAAWTLQHLLRSSDFEWTAERADDWRLPWPAFTSTRYEEKAKREGRTPCYLVFRRR